MKLIYSFIVVLLFSIIVTGVYYFFPIQQIPAEVVVDEIIVLKSKHELYAFSKGKLVVRYKVAIGKNPEGAKEFEGDLKTPEGLYFIDSKNAVSGWHKSLGVSYPNEKDILNARKSGRPTGGNIKIHGLKNGKGFIGCFHRWTDWTNGCIALTDQEMDQIFAHTPVGTPIEIRK